MLNMRNVVMMTLVAVLLFVAQACGGGGSGDAEPTVTAVPLPDAAGGGGPGGQPQGFRGGGLLAGIAEPDEELAAFFGLSLSELEEELGVDGATLGKIAESTGRSREDLQAFLLDRAEAALAEDGGAGNFPGNQDARGGQLDAIIDSIIDGEGFGGGNFPDGPPGGGPGAPRGFGGGGLFGLGGDNEELAGLLGLSIDELSELLADEETTLADVAADNGIPREELFDFLLAQVESNIEQAVSDGTLAQENADQFLNGIADTINGFIDGTGFGGQRPFGRAATPETS